MRLEASNIHKHYGPDRALRGASLQLAMGEIHALLGENGAGKSTLARILGGAEPPGAGAMRLDERQYAPRQPLEALRLGVASMGSAPRLPDELTVEEAVALGLEPSRGGWIARHSLREQVTWALDRLESRDLPLTAKTGSLSLPDRQRVELARALLIGTRVLILDEPTRALAQWETGALFNALRRLAASGVAILFITHFLEEAFALCDRYTVLREGRTAASGVIATATKARLLEAMAGAPMVQGAPPPPRRKPHFGRGVLWLENVSSRNGIREVSLKLHEGEILGLAGLDGAGRGELLRMILRREPLRSGKIWRGGTSGLSAPANDGVFESMDVAENLLLPALCRYSFLGLLSPEREMSAARDWIAKLRLHTRSPRLRGGTLPGGSRQKLRLGRLLLQDPAVLLLDEPTRGMDARSQLEVHRLVESVAAQGKGVLWVGNNPGELLLVCHNIAVLRRGRLVEIRPSGKWTEPEMIAAALGPP